MELEEEGIVAREHFTCCGSCGASQIHDEADSNHFGYVFYHVQETESEQEPGNLYIINILFCLINFHIYLIYFLILGNITTNN
jgi:hypothetical protein